MNPRECLGKQIRVGEWIRVNSKNLWSVEQPEEGARNLEWM